MKITLYTCSSFPILTTLGIPPAFGISGSPNKRCLMFFAFPSQEVTAKPARKKNKTKTKEAGSVGAMSHGFPHVPHGNQQRKSRAFSEKENS